MFIAFLVAKDDIDLTTQVSNEADYNKALEYNRSLEYSRSLVIQIIIKCA